MKVSEAKGKVCPFIAQMGEDSSGFTVFSKHINCICEDCMAWVYTKEEDIIIEEWVERYGKPSEKDNVTSVYLGEGTYKHQKVTNKGTLKENEKEGYCARIGK